MDHNKEKDYMSTKAEFALTKTFTPILNTPDFKEVFGGKDGISLPLDNQNLLRAVETILFPYTKVRIQRECDNCSVVQITSNEYNYPGNFFTDIRFLTLLDEQPIEREILLPSKPTILKDLKKLLGIPYIWGGNHYKGVSELLSFYPPKKPIPNELKTIWKLSGVDCSGLLYAVTNGYTPRNTSSLLKYGQAVEIKELTPQEIQKKLQPLDLIVWRGHVIIVLDDKDVIESRGGKGVVITFTEERLQELALKDKKRPANLWQESSSQANEFVVRRWFPD